MAILKPGAHQAQTIKKFKTIDRRFDASDPGTGKTRGALDVWGTSRNDGEGCALVLAPKSLLETAWLEDLNKFLPGAMPSIAYASNREKAFQANADIYITNLDAVKWLAQQPTKFFKRFDTLIIDESTAFKHRTSQRSKACRNIVKHYQNRFLL